MVGRDECLALVVVLVAGDVVLLPIAEGDFENAEGFGAACRNAEAVFFVGGNPVFLSGDGRKNLVADLDLGTVIDGDPEFGAGGVGLEGEALSGVDGHEGNGGLAVVGVLFECAPRTGDGGDGGLFGGDGFGDVAHLVFGNCFNRGSTEGRKRGRLDGC